MSYKFSSSSVVNYDTGIVNDSFFAGDFTVFFWAKFSPGANRPIGLVQSWGTGQSLSILAYPQGLVEFSYKTPTGAKGFQFNFGDHFGRTWTPICVRRRGTVLACSVEVGGTSKQVSGVSLGVSGPSVASSSTLKIGTTSAILDSTNDSIAGVGYWPVVIDDLVAAIMSYGVMPYNGSGTPKFLGTGYTDSTVSVNALSDITLWLPLQASPESETSPSATLNVSGTGIVVTASDPTWITQIGGSSTTKGASVVDRLSIYDSANAVSGVGTVASPVISDIDPTGAISGSYLNLQLWWNAVKTSSNPAQWARCWPGNMSFAEITGASFTPTATAYPWIFSAGGAHHTGTKGSIDSSAYLSTLIGDDVITTGPLQIDIPYFRMTGIAVKNEQYPSGAGAASIIVTKSDTLIEQCLFNLPDAGIAVKYNFPSGTHTLRFHNNIVQGDISSDGINVGININADDSTASSTVTGTIYNNTFDFPDYLVSDIAVQSQTQLGYGGGFAGLLIKNNIVPSNAFQFEQDLGQFATIDTNIYIGDSSWNSSPSGAPVGSGYQQGDSNYLFVDDPKFLVAGQDWRLDYGSSAVGFGLNLSSSFTNDALGNPRTSPWSAGALAYESATGSVYEQYPSDVLTVTSTASAIGGSITPVSTALTVSDSVTVQKILIRSLSDSLTLTAAGSGFTGLDSRYFLSNSITISDSVSVRAPIYISIRDAVVLSNNFPTENLKIGNVSTPLVILDFVNISKKLGIATDSLILADIGDAFTNHKYFNDRLTVADATRSNLQVFSLSDSLLIRDSMLRGGATYASILDVVDLSDGFTSNQKVFEWNDGLQFAESIQVWNTRQQIQDFYTITDQAGLRFSKANLRLSDILNIQDSLFGYNPHVYDTLVISDEAHRVFERTFSDSISILEQYGILQEISDIIEIDDILVSEKTRPVTDILAILQVLCVKIKGNLLVHDTLTFQDSASAYNPNGSSIGNNPGGTGTGNTGFSVSYKKRINQYLDIVETVGVEGGQPEFTCILSE